MNSPQVKLNPYFLPILIFSLILFISYNVFLQKGENIITTSSDPQITAFATNPQTTDTINWKTYKNELYGFEFQYPQEWNAADNQTNHNYPSIILGPLLILVQTCGNSETDKVKPCFSSFNEAVEATKSQYIKDTLVSKEYFMTDRIGYLLQGQLGQNMEGINTQKEVIIPYQNHELTIIFKDYQQKIFDQPELDKVFDRILSTFKFLDEEKEKISVKLYYHDLSTDSSFNSCTADKFKVIEVSPENKIKETIERLLTEGNMEKHPDFKLLNMNLKNGILTLEFPFIPSFTTGGSCRIMLMTDQITKTAKQFEEVKEVRFKPEVFEP